MVGVGRSTKMIHGHYGVQYSHGKQGVSLAPLDLLGSVSIGLISFKSPGAFSTAAE